MNCAGRVSQERAGTVDYARIDEISREDVVSFGAVFVPMRGDDCAGLNFDNGGNQTARSVDVQKSRPNALCRNRARDWEGDMRNVLGVYGKSEFEKV